MARYRVRLDIAYEFEVEAPDEDDASDLAIDMYNTYTSNALEARTVSFDTQPAVPLDDDTLNVPSA